MKEIRTINFCNKDIVNALTAIARIRFGYSEDGKYKRASTNNPLVNKALRNLTGMPGGHYRYMRCMYKIDLANTTYSYIMGGISEESFKEFLREYDENDKRFWCKNDNFNTLETKLLTA